MVKDPVCGMDVEEQSTPHHTTYHHQNYYFCCDGCLNLFNEKPEKYIQSQDPAPCCHHEKTASPPSPPIDESIAKELIYICPMCEGVRQVGPGNCPICGMALEPENLPLSSDYTGTQHTELDEMRWRFWLSTGITLPLFLLAMFPQLQWQQLSPTAWQWFQAALATLVLFWAGRPILHRAVVSFKTMQLNMFSLIGLGVSVAWFYSIVATLFPEIFPTALVQHNGTVAVYYESAAMIMVLVLAGQVMELKARQQTSQAIQSLLDLTPKTATVVTDCGHDKTVAVADINVGDTLRIRPGDSIPVDGVIIEGDCYVNEAMMTGEANVVAKHVDDTLIAGTINQDGLVLMKAEKVGTNTLLAQIIQYVNQAQRSRAPVQKKVDQIARYFVPIVITISMITFFIWWLLGPSPALAHGIVNAVAVLIIACPCALGLATPMSIMVGTGRGAKAGILVKDAQSIERFEQITTLIVDKTGTLTLGQPQVAAIHVLAELDENSLLKYAASLEKGSSHPIATAIVDAAAHRPLILEDIHEFEHLTGHGVSGLVGGLNIKLGHTKWLAEQGIDVTLFSQVTLEPHLTPVYIAINGQAAGIISLHDPIKTHAADSIQAIQAQGIDVIVLSGDAEAPVKAVARECQIATYQAHCLPEDKLHYIEALQAKGQVVAMAGDGINDAPALAQADIGIAMGDGTDIAMETADITLLKGELAGINRALKLSRATMKNIRQNLFFAFIYNTAGIPVAAGLLYPVFSLLLSPMIAAAAMSLSSVCVITNALRLSRLKL
jgi:Cu+-exporting ATPase